jgi:predicted DsbA family dithiol-disulfide isomerase
MNETSTSPEATGSGSRGGSPSPSSTLPIDVISDVVCPWCYLGKRRLEHAISLLPQHQFVVRWHPFRLDPTIPPGGIDRTEYLVNKFGTLDAIAPAHANLTAFGEREGIAFRFDRIARAPNTVDAHRLVRWATFAGKGEAMVERLFRAYFSEGIDVGDPLALCRLAADAGLTGDIAARLSSQDDIAEVTAEVEEAYRIGVTGVPCFIIDRRYAVVGAHPAETLVEAIGQAEAARKTEAP